MRSTSARCAARDVMQSGHCAKWSSEGILLDLATFLIKRCEPLIPSANLRPLEQPGPTQGVRKLFWAKESCDAFMMLAGYLAFALTLWIDDDREDPQSRWLKPVQRSRLCPGKQPMAHRQTEFKPTTEDSVAYEQFERLLRGPAG
ncbi:hypothetical protein BD779DRAFT_236519 [Infundibulicybe gibba]|nr:hypothetical protein BD779DRAFT_236519 [Infundibulicybe gibba]